MVDELLRYMDVSLLYGYRNAREQNTLFAQGKSKLRFPRSKHNQMPSLAVDIQPYPYPENENDLRAALGYMAGICWMIAEREGFKIRWGGDWNRNGDVTDNGFDDLFHLELYDEETDPRLARGNP
jgi:peptidoglycan L-alanyl-D-glutamate endopeptidase CwlK